MPPALDRHGLSRRTAALLAVAAVVSVVHHVDHVLRVDHSGWPFRPDVTPFTFSLLAYPMIVFALWGPLRLFAWRWALLATGTGFTILAHTAIESPRMQYVMWASDCSAEPAQAGVHNLLDVHSPGLGLAAVAVSMTLNLLAVAGTVSMAVDGVRRRRRARA